ncbi:MAG: ribonuclease P protein component [Dehalococcoidia bacterium]|nr:ribonuclease P protein component [Dehalococcoidia bacterium]
MERARRLRKGDEFDQTYREGTAVSGPLLVVRYRPRGGPGVRWGFAVGKRLTRSAVARNRVRRRLREAARQLGVVDGVDLVVTARKGALEADFASLQVAIQRALTRARLLREAPAPAAPDA